MRNCTLDTAFDVIIAWDSFFHLSKEDQRLMFKVFSKHAKSRTYLLFTVGPKDGEVISQMEGIDFYWAQ